LSGEDGPDNGGRPTTASLIEQRAKTIFGARLEDGPPE
jgi:hypothetical protein